MRRGNINKEKCAADSQERPWEKKQNVEKTLFKTRQQLDSPFDGQQNCNENPKGIIEKVKRFFREYGKVGLLVYIAISSTTFMLCYLGVQAGLDLQKLARLVHLEVPSWGDKAGSLLVTYATYKLLLPLRLALTAATTPYVKRWFK